MTRDAGPARPWLLGIAARCLADHLRDRYRRAEAFQRLGAQPAFTPDEAERVDGDDRRRRGSPSRSSTGLRQLTDAERELLLLVAEEGLAGRRGGARARHPRARRAHAAQPRPPQAAAVHDHDHELEARFMSIELEDFEDQLAVALRAHAAEQLAPARRRRAGAAVAARAARRRRRRSRRCCSCCPAADPAPASAASSCARPPRPPSAEPPLPPGQLPLRAPRASRRARPSRRCTTASRSAGRAPTAPAASSSATAPGGSSRTPRCRRQASGSAPRPSAPRGCAT